MKNVLYILRRDMKRLFMVPAAWIIVAGMIVLPALYAWVNIIGFWDPYGNTESIEVAVANTDEGASSSITGHMDLGKQIVSQLKSNHQLGWHFVSESQAMDEVRSGKSYAAIVIPKDFSTNITSVVSGDFKQPAINYYVNEKLSAIAPKVTDTGATTLDNQINTTFVSTVANVAAKTMKSALTKAGTSLESARSDTGKTLTESQKKLAKASDDLGSMASDIDGSRAKVANAKKTLGDAQNLLNTLGRTATTSSTLLNQISTTTGAFSNSAFTTLGNGSNLLNQISTTTSGTVGNLSGAVLNAQGAVGGTLTAAQSIANSNSHTIQNLKGITNEVGLDEGTKQDILNVLDDLTTQNQQDADLISHLVDVNNDMGSTANSLNSTTDSLNAAIHNTTHNGDVLRESLSTSTIPTLTSGVSQLGATTGQLGAGLSGQNQLITNANGLLNQLDSVLGNTAKALDTAKGTLDGISGDLGTAATDITALGTSAAWKGLLDTSSINSKAIAKNLSSPTHIQQKALFPVPTYGSAMAPLFTNISLWVGAFMLVVLLKLEVDKEGVDDLTPGQGYMGRWLLMACFAAAQALIVTVGDLIIGVQTINAFAFVVTGILSSLAYLSIEYALAKSFAHVGKGICVLIIMLQIPGASGLYPIEMMPGFFRAIYPLLPFTYGIDAMRETIGGFYDAHYAIALGTLAIFVAIAFAVGLLARRYLINVNRLFADELDQTEIFVGEKAETSEHTYRLTQVIHALVDKVEYRADTIAHAHRFEHNYRRMKRGATIFGFVIPLILSLVFSLSNGKKVVILALWVVWILLIIGFLVTIEYIRDSIARQVDLGNMPESDIRSILRTRYKRRLHRERSWRLTHPRLRHPKNPSDAPIGEQTVQMPTVSDDPNTTHEGGAR